MNANEPFSAYPRTLSRASHGSDGTLISRNEAHLHINKVEDGGEGEGPWETVEERV